MKKVESTNRKGLDGRHVAKILNAEEDKLPVTMPHELRIALAQSRNNKGLTQEKLAQLLQVPKADVNAWEAGKSVPSGGILAKMDKVLGVKLPRPNKKWLIWYVCNFMTLSFITGSTQQKIILNNTRY